MTRAEQQLKRDLRQLVVDHVEHHAGAAEKLAGELRVPVESVDVLMERPKWDLDLTLKLLDVLNVAPRVVV